MLLAILHRERSNKVFGERLRRDCSLPLRLVYFDYFLYVVMSSEAEKAAAEKLAQEEAAAAKKIADELAAASSASVAAIWPNGGYDLLTPFIFVFIYAMLIVCVHICVIYVDLSCMVKYQYKINLACVMFMIYLGIKLLGKLLIYPTRECVD